MEKTPRKARRKPPAPPEADNPPEKGSALEERLYAQMIDAGLKPEREYRFCPDRRWRADMAFPEVRLMIEVEGGLFGKPIICDKCKLPVMRRLPGGRTFPVREAGRHNTGAGFQKDAEKYNWAEMHGWMVLRFSGTMIKSGEAIKLILEAYRFAKENRDE